MRKAYELRQHNTEFTRQQLARYNRARNWEPTVKLETMTAAQALDMCQSDDMSVDHYYMGMGTFDTLDEALRELDGCTGEVWRDCYSGKIMVQAYSVAAIGIDDDGRNVFGPEWLGEEWSGDRLRNEYAEDDETEE